MGEVWEKVTGLYNIYRRRQSGILYRRVYIEKEGSVFRSLGEREYNRRAKEVERQMLGAVHLVTEPQRAARYAVIAEQCFLQSMAENRPRTIEEARRIYDRLIEAAGDRTAEQCDDIWWVKSLAKWRGETYRSAKKPRTHYAHIRVYAKQIDRFAVKKGKKSQLNQFKLSDPQTKEGRVIAPEDFERLFLACGDLGGDRAGLMASVLLCMWWEMGMRRREATLLTWDRCDLDEGVITLRAEDVKTGKRTRRGRQIPMSSRVKALLTKMKTKKSGPWVFPKLSGKGPLEHEMRWVRTLRKKTSIQFNPHDLRHSFLTRKLVVEKKSPLLVSEYVGTRISTIQKVYLHTKAKDLEGVVS